MMYMLRQAETLTGVRILRVARVQRWNNHVRLYVSAVVLQATPRFSRSMTVSLQSQHHFLNSILFLLKLHI